jgi:adenylate cyclase
VRPPRTSRTAGRNWPLWAALAATALAALLYLGHHRGLPVPGLARLELTTIDTRFRLRGPLPLADDRIVIVGLDDRTRREAPDVFQTRRGWARLIDALAAQRPQAIALDLFFSSPEIILPAPLARQVEDAAAVAAAEPSPSPALAAARDALAAVREALRGDEVLAAAIARARVVYLGAGFRMIESAADRPAAPPAEPAGLERAQLDDAVGGAAGAPSAYAVSTTLQAIAAGAQGAGAINHLRDDDGVARRMALVIEMGGRYYASLGFVLAARARGEPTRYVAPTGAVSLGDRALPTRAAVARLNFLGRRFPRVSAADLLAGRTPAGALAGKLVLVGFTHAAYDKVPTPDDPLADGVELHATLLHNLLHEGLLRDGGAGAGLASVLVLGGLVALVHLRRLRRRPWLPPIIAAGLLVAWLALAQLAFARGLVLEVLPPALALALAVAAGTIASIATEGREKARLRGAFAQYVSKTLVERIVEHPDAARLGGERRELSVLFSDIRGFSRLAESLPPEQLAGFLNRYLTPMTELVLDRDGTLDKYIGDAVMAVWNAPVDVPDHAARACDAALAMQRALGPLNARWREQGLPQIEIGVGINTGPMAVGNMGSEARFDYTVLGDAVNLAARLEALTKEYGVGILVGEATRVAAGDRFVFREMDMVRVKGKDRAARIFELCGTPATSPHSADEVATWDAMIAACRARDFAGARQMVDELAARHPGDGAARVFAARVRELAAAPPADDWDGVYEQRSK